MEQAMMLSMLFFPPSPGTEAIFTNSFCEVGPNTLTRYETAARCSLYVSKFQRFIDMAGHGLAYEPHGRPTSRL